MGDLNTTKGHFEISWPLGISNFLVYLLFKINSSWLTFVSKYLSLGLIRYTKDNQDSRENEMKIPINFKIIFWISPLRNWQERMTAQRKGSAIYLVEWQQLEIEVKKQSTLCFYQLNPKRKNSFQFCLPELLQIHRNPKQKEFFRCND